jgi:3'-phosphoadenosine 5'-phosphosulfate sulfotransferase (PAPS reductase)/FAD synthetase
VGREGGVSNPYLIAGPALISFSGGRTSAFMLHQIIQAHGGKLPDDVVVVFANTGKEREETLRFVHECETRWSVRVHWIEWHSRKPWFEEVGYNSASRNGEPFDRLIKSKGKRLPNSHQRSCTELLKVKAIFGFARSIGWPEKTYKEVLGLRRDEPMRLLRMGGQNVELGRKCVAPLDKAMVTKADVMAFWRAQEFDLGLQPWEGNCDLCFLKGRAIRRRIIRDNPDAAQWWHQRELNAGGTFDKGASIADLVEQVRASPTLFDEPEGDEFDAECGLSCSAEAA